MAKVQVSKNYKKASFILSLLLVVLCSPKQLVSRTQNGFDFGNNIPLHWKKHLHLYTQYALPLGNLKLYPIIADSSFLRYQPPGVQPYTSLAESVLRQKVGLAEANRLHQLVNKPSQATTFLPDSAVNIHPPISALPPTSHPSTTNIYTNNWIHKDAVLMANMSARHDKIYINNFGKDTLYIMAGELLQGGLQDRVVAQNTLVPPASGPTPLQVYCAEENRWNYTDYNHKNNWSYGVLASQNMRLAINKSYSQEMLWQLIDWTMLSLQSQNETKSYLAMVDQGEFKINANRFVQAALQSYPDLEHAVGILAVSGSRVIGCDIFAHTALFRKQLPNLLFAYSVEALVNGSPPRVTDLEALQYIENLLQKSEHPMRNAYYHPTSGKLLQITGF